MFVKQPNRQLQQLLAVENKTILQQLKPSTLYMMFQLTLCEAASKKRLKHLLAAEKKIYTQAKIVKSLHDMF